MREEQRERLERERRVGKHIDKKREIFKEQEMDRVFRNIKC